MTHAAPRLALAPRPESASAARRFVADTLAAWGLPGLVDVAVLLVSELVTNALLHAGTAIEVDCVRGRDAVRVSVLDGASAPGAPRAYPADAATGRGLLIVQSLADDWGVSPAPEGKCTWFELKTPAAAGRR